MGDIADMMLEGDLCCVCGCCFEEGEIIIPGIPNTCTSCLEDDRKENGLKKCP